MANDASSSPAQWVLDGSMLFSQALSEIDDDHLSSYSLLPDWTRAHVVAHVAANAQAIGRLLSWATTGEPTPMYSSMTERDREIAEGSTLKPDRLREWFNRSDFELQSAISSLSPEAWENVVVTAQGREVPARETLWMRSREVCIHAVDLRAGINFGDLPEGFLIRLIEEASAKQSAVANCPTFTLQSETGQRWDLGGMGEETTVFGSLGALAAWLTGRSSDGVRDQEGDSPPVLAKWL